MLISGAWLRFSSGFVAIPLRFCKPFLWWVLKYYANTNLPRFAISCEVSSTEPASHLERSNTHTKLLRQRSQDTFSFRLFFCFNPKNVINLLSPPLPPFWDMILKYRSQALPRSSKVRSWGQLSARAHINNLCRMTLQMQGGLPRTREHYLHMEQGAASPALYRNTWNNCFTKDMETTAAKLGSSIWALHLPDSSPTTRTCSRLMPLSVLPHWLWFLSSVILSWAITVQNATLFPYCLELAQASLLIKLWHPQSKVKQVNHALAVQDFEPDNLRSRAHASAAIATLGRGRKRRQPGHPQPLSSAQKWLFY